MQRLKSGEGLTPEQCLFIAEGGLWSDLQENFSAVDNSVQEAVEENYQANQESGSLGDDGNDDKVDVSKEGALSDEELAGINF
ncbi:hypothetical protein [Bacillus anthracis]